MLRRQTWLAFCLLIAAATAFAAKPADIDARAEQSAQAPRELSATERKLVQAGKRIQYEERLGVPTFLWAAPSAVGEKKARAARVSGATRIDAAAEALRNLATYASFYGLEKRDLASARIVEVHDTGEGAIIVKLKEDIGGIEVFREQLSVMMDRGLEPIALSGYLSGAARKIAANPVTFRLDERAVAAIAIADRTGKSMTVPELVTTGARQGPYGFVDHGARTMRMTESEPGQGASPLTLPVRFKQVYFHTADGFEPAYYLEVSAELLDADGAIDNDLYSYVISATDGRILFRMNLTVNDVVNYRVWATGPGSSADVPSDSPHGDITTPHPTGVPDGSFPPFIPSAIHSLQAYPFSHSATDPWLPPGATETVGNNVDAYLDRFGGDGYQPGAGDFRANTTSANTFDYTYDPTVDALANTTQQKASITSLFYVDNFLHDFFYDAGFNEASGNAQQDNYGRGGIGGDTIRAEAQDSSGTNNANMSTPADGGRPTQQMYIWTGQTTRFITINSQPGGGTLLPQYGPLRTGISTTFGAQSFDVTANIVRADPPDGCSIIPLTNAAALVGKIVLVDRGGVGGNCAGGFVQKTKNVQDAGGLGAIIANVASSATPATPPAMGGVDATVTIGALSLNLDDGNAFRSTLALGTVNGRLFRLTSPVRRDGSIDAHVISHEWGHYLSNRLIADAAGLGNKQGGGMGEGWGDFVALLTTLREGDNLVGSNPNFSGAYPMVPYAAVATAPDGYYFGIRRVPYSTNLAIDPLTFKHISNASPIVPTFTGPCDGCTGNNPEVHNTGEVWTTMLWECYAALLNNHPFTDARLRMRNYLVAGLKMTPANPTFTEARDAVLAAAFAGDPADHALLCAAFAKRGIGQLAVSPDRFSSTNSPVTESFECTNNVVFVSTSLSAPTDSCDTDTYLDNSETATLSVTFKNISGVTLSNTTANISSANPNIFFSNGGVMTFPPAAPFQNTTGTILVSMFGASGIQDFYIDIAADDPDISAPIPVVHLDVRGNANDVAAVSKADTVEARLTPWSTTGGFNGTWVQQQLIPTPPTLPPPPFNYSWHAPDQGGTSDIRLTSPILNVGAGGTTFTFKHRFQFENTFDGGVIETSIDNGATWQDIGAANLSPTYAAGLLVGVGGGSDNPIGGRRAYTNNSAGYPAMVTVTGTLGAAFGGLAVKIRFRAGSDQGVGASGWDVDDIDFNNNIGNTPFSIVVAQGPTPTVDALSPAHAWVGLKNSDDVGTNWDFLAEVLRNGVVIATGTLTNQPSGSSGFNNAKDRVIALALSAPGQSGACPGDTLSIRLSVRVTAVGGHRSGTARLWYNDGQANSRFDVTIGGVNSNLYLLNGFVLGTSQGAGPKLSIDVFSDRAVGGNPWKPFGTWTKTF